MDIKERNHLSGNIKCYESPRPKDDHLHCSFHRSWALFLGTWGHSKGSSEKNGFTMSGERGDGGTVIWSLLRRVNKWWQIRSQDNHTTTMNTEALKKLAAIEAVNEIKDEKVIGLGTGSTTRYAVDEIGQRLKEGKLSGIVCVSTSEKTRKQVGVSI